TPLPELWPRIRDFVREWCRVPPGPPDAAKLLDETIADVCASRAASGLRGREAIDYLVTALRTRRYPHGRHGEPRVFAGLPADAALLSFRAVRVLGAVEGALPGTPREDPNLPDAARAWLNGWKPGALLATSADRVLRETHEVFLAVTAARERLALGAAQQWVDGTDRELAGPMLETAVALGRPDPVTGAPEAVPSLGSLRRLYVGPGNEARLAADRARPATARAALRMVAALGDGARRPVAPGWVSPADGLFSLARLRAIEAERESDEYLRSDGLLGSASLTLPGLDPTRGISASALSTFLGCPHRYLLESVLHFRPVARAPSIREIDPMPYGSLVHRVVERFFRAHGEAFCRRERSLHEWRDLAGEVADATFTDFLREYPLAGDGAVEAQRRRLRRDVGYLPRAQPASTLSRRGTPSARSTARPWRASSLPRAAGSDSPRTCSPSGASRTPSTPMPARTANSGRCAATTPRR